MKTANSNHNTATVYGIFDKGAKGNEQPNWICPSLADAKKHIAGHPERRKDREDIRPLKVKFPGGDRYRVCNIEPWRRMLGDDYTPGDKWIPKHLLDFPQDSLIEGYDELYWYPDAFQSRADAIENVAEWNAKKLSDKAEDRFQEWNVAIEVGLPFCRCLTSTNLQGNIGVEDTNLWRPIRLVYPTWAEIKRLGKGPLNLESVPHAGKAVQI